MLTASDSVPIIKHAILKKLDAERGIKLIEYPVESDAEADPPHIRVGVVALIDDTLIAKARFDLPLQFELRQVHNEIDEIAEKFKEARRHYWSHGRPPVVSETALGGSGLRGQWPK